MSESQPTYVGGQVGHLSIHEARLWALERVEKLEGEEEEARSIVDARIADLAEAQRKFDGAHRFHVQTINSLHAARDDLARRISMTSLADKTRRNKDGS